MPSISLDTVYRTLATFEACGMVTKLRGPDGRARFDGNPRPHHHLVCRECERIQDFTWPVLDELRPPPNVEGWGEISGVQVELRGLCVECLDAKRPRGERP